jgi:hypothetical protein
MKIIGVAAGLVVGFTTIAGAQVTGLVAPGNLAATVNPGCVAVAAAGPALSPPDIALGALDCAAAGDWDQMVDLYVLMQLRAVFDTRRVADVTAHQAGEVLAMEVTAALPAGGTEAMGEAFSRLGETGSVRHQAICAAAVAGGPPRHDPAWMIQHGMGAFTGVVGDGLVPGFDADATWQEMLQGYLKCGA